VRLPEPTPREVFEHVSRHYAHWRRRTIRMAVQDSRC